MSRDPYLPLFFYGTLRESASGAWLVGESVERRESASAIGTWREVSTEYPAVSFNAQDGVEIEGELVWITRSEYPQVLERLDRQEGTPTLFRRVRVPVRVGSEQLDAFAYEWADPFEYLEAARRKVAIATYHADMLKREVAAAHEASIAVQAHFEGVLYALIAAADQLAEAVNIGFDLNLSEPSLQDALEHIEPSGLRSRLLKWLRAPIFVDGRDIRRRATHHHYLKKPLRLELNVQAPTRAKPYGGPRSLEEYVTAAVEHADHLLPLIEELDRAIRGKTR